MIILSINIDIMNTIIDLIDIEIDKLDIIINIIIGSIKISIMDIMASNIIDIINVIFRLFIVIEAWNFQDQLNYYSCHDEQQHAQ